MRRASASEREVGVEVAGMDVIGADVVGGAHGSSPLRSCSSGMLSRFIGFRFLAGCFLDADRRAGSLLFGDPHVLPENKSSKLIFVMSSMLSELVLSLPLEVILSGLICRLLFWASRRVSQVLLESRFFVPHYRGYATVLC